MLFECGLSSSLTARDQVVYTAWSYKIKEVIHLLDKTQQGGSRFHRAIQNDVQFKSHKLHTSGIFHLYFGPQLTGGN
jgi:hypothetical protein